MKTLLMTVILFPALTFAQNGPDLSYIERNGHSVLAEKKDWGEPTLKANESRPTAKGISPVDDGAIVCQSLDEVNWLFREIGRARVARSYMPEQARQLAKLQDGYDQGAEPRPSDYRCQLVPTGTPMNVQWKSGIPVVFGTMNDGRPFAGVTNPQMVDR